mgnify:CR=1 FL=1
MGTKKPGKPKTGKIDSKRIKSKHVEILTVEPPTIHQEEPVRSWAVKHNHAIFALRSLLIIAMIAIVATAAASMYLIRSTLRSEMFSSAHREVTILAEASRDALASESELQLLSAIQSAKMNPSIVKAYVLDRDGRIRQNFDPEMNGKVLDDAIPRRIFDESNHNKPALIGSRNTEYGTMYTFALHLHERLYKQRLGTVRIDYSERATIITARTLSIKIAAIAIAGIISLIVVMIHQGRRLRETT